MGGKEEKMIQLHPQGLYCLMWVGKINGSRGSNGQHQAIWRLYARMVAQKARAGSRERKETAHLTGQSEMVPQMAS